MTDERLSLSFDAIHDADAGVWVATSAAGRITTEAPSREALIERLKVIVRMFLKRDSVAVRAMYRSSSIGRSCAPSSRLN